MNDAAAVSVAIACLLLPACSSNTAASEKGDAGGHGGPQGGEAGRTSGSNDASAADGATGGAGGRTNGGSAGSGATSGSPNAGRAGSGDGGAAGGGATSKGGMTSSGGSTSSGGKGGGGSAGAGGATGTGITAVRASDFLASLGVCTHIGQGVDDAAKSATALAYAGIHEIRDDGTPSHVKDWITVHQQSGVRLSLLTNRNVAGTIDMAKQLAAEGALLAVEGPNEPNNFAVTYENATSSFDTTFVPVAHLQRDLYAAVKAEPMLAGIPVFHASEAGGSEPDNVGLQFLTIPKGAGTTMPEGTAYADYANVHNYVSGHSGQLLDNTAWNASDPTLNGDWDGLYVEYGKTWHGGFKGYTNAELITLPRVTTETGWQTSGNVSISQEEQARLFLSLYLSAYKRGYGYTFIYMLRDDPNQGYWGLFDTSYAAKKSGTYLHNLTTILADTGGGAPGRLDYTVPSEPATVHDLLMQKSDGTFELAIWNDRPSGGSNDVTVKFAAAPASLKVYDPTSGTSVRESHDGAAMVTLALTDHPAILEISR